MKTKARPGMMLQALPIGRIVNSKRVSKFILQRAKLTGWGYNNKR